jgi:FixJ family two-component response regulator
MQHATPIVFVVDDDISVRESLEALIRCEGWEPETFASAQEFLTRPRVVTPSCLILDVDLPDLSGLDLQKCIASDRKDMPIIHYWPWRCAHDGQSHESRSRRVLNEAVQ